MAEKLKGRLRLAVQAVFTLLTNANLRGFFTGKIFTGPTKRFCVPGLNCYSCPGALGSCPIGSLQAVAGSPKYSLSFYVSGFILAVGALAGRFVCGWLCPFGLVQELVYKLPPRKKLAALPGDKFLRYAKYAVLAALVLALPAFLTDAYGQGTPWFCKLLCPSGTLMAGIPLLLANAPLRGATGGLFAWKMAVLIALLAQSAFIYRPFCRYLCPLGAVYSLFNPIALYRLRFDGSACVNCGKCARVCKMGVKLPEKPNGAECIRCGECLRACPTGALRSTLWKKADAKQNRL